VSAGRRECEDDRAERAEQSPHDCLDVQTRWLVAAASLAMPLQRSRDLLA
jgi:hypothetical protein